MLRRTYDWMMRLAARPDAPAWLAGLAFVEGFCFPIPPDILLAPMVLGNRRSAWRYASICLGASVLGGSVGYMIGYFLQPVGNWLLTLTGSNPQEIYQWFKQWGVLLLALPIPYKVTAIVSGALKFPFAVFFVASLLIRGLRFFLVAGLIRAYGEPVQSFIEKRLALVVSAVALGVIGLFIVLRFAV